MPWARLDDRYHSTPKIKKAWRNSPAAIVLHVFSITHCAQHETNGRIEKREVDLWLYDSGLTPKQKQAALNTLLDLNLLTIVDSEHYEVHDFLKFNRSREDREADRINGKKGGRPSKPKPLGVNPHPLTPDENPSVSPEGQGSSERQPSPAQPSHIESVTQTLPPRKRGAGKRVDQEALPPSLPEGLHDRARECLRILSSVQGERGGNEPTLRGVGLALDRFRDRDHVSVARELEHWALAGRGQGKPVMDWAGTLATFLKNSPAGAPVRTNGHVVPLNRRPSASDLLARLDERPDVIEATVIEEGA